jgi:hypothetical protein
MYEKKDCPKCDKEVEAVWKFNRVRCRECGEILDKDSDIAGGFLMFNSPYFYNGQFHRHPRHTSTDHNVIHRR